MATATYSIKTINYIPTDGNDCRIAIQHYRNEKAIWVARKEKYIDFQEKIGELKQLLTNASQSFSNSNTTFKNGGYTDGFSTSDGVSISSISEDIASIDLSSIETIIENTIEKIEEMVIRANSYLCEAENAYYSMGYYSF